MAWTSPRTWVAGEKPSAATLNTHIRDNFNALTTFGTYTPTWTGVTANPSLGNGTIEGRYISAGKLVIFSLTLTMGSTTTYGTGGWIFTLPVTARSGAPNMPIGQCGLKDAGLTNPRMFHAVLDTTTTFQPMNEAGTGVSATVPFTWATSDTLEVNGWYEAA